MMTILRFLIGAAIVVLFMSSANSSRFVYIEQDDPFSEGVCLKTPQVRIVAGDAIRSERFGVNWSNGIRPDIILCNSGFVYFGGDSELTEDEESNIREFLEKIGWIDFSNVSSISPELLIWLLEETYKRREVDSNFWLEFHQSLTLLGPELEAQRKARIMSVFATKYSDFQDDPRVHYVMSGYYARERLIPEACEALHRGDQIMSREDFVLTDLERARLSDYRAYAIADLLSSEDSLYGKIRLSDCNDLKKENEHIPDREVPE